MTLPPFLLQIVSFGQIQSCLEPRVKILDDPEILLLHSRCDLEDRTSSKLSIRKSMMGVDDSSCGHELSFVEVRMVGDVSCHS